MKIHQLSCAQALESLQSGPAGLANTEAARRLAEYGPNRLRRIRRKSLLLRFVQEFTHFFAIILWIAMAMAFCAEAIQPGQGMAMLGFAIVGVIFINGAFSFWQEYRAEKVLAALEKLLPDRLPVVRNGLRQLLSADDLVPGDLIELAEGDRVPADCRILEGSHLLVNDSVISGEPHPHSRDAEVSADAEALQSHNLLFAGTTLVAGAAKAVVFATGDHTVLGKIAHIAQGEKARVSPLQQELMRMSRFVGLLALALGTLFFAIGNGIGLSFWSNFMFAIGIIVANVPEGLLPTVTLALAIGAQRMAKRKALVRHLPAIEALGATTVICTDKTGTLTQNKLSVDSVFAGGSWEKPHRDFLEIAAHCHDLKSTTNSGERAILGDPMETALVDYARHRLATILPLKRVGELQFDSFRKRLSILYIAESGLTLYTKGAPETVLPLCTTTQWNGAVVTLSSDIRRQVVDTHERMARSGLRVLALAYRRLPAGCNLESAEHDLVLAGLVGLTDPPRPEVPEAIRQCIAAGIKTIMITGDHPGTAKAIALRVGMIKSDNPRVITGPELNHLSDTQLQLALDAPELIFARVAADQKLRIVTALQRKNEVVAVTGDGVNDAPALKSADIGIAMGLSGTDVARESADIVLLDDNFATIVSAIEEGRAVFANIRKFLTYIFTSNVPELVPYIAYACAKIPLPLTIIQILAVDLGTDMVPALALGAEKPGPTIMHQPPRSRGERLLTMSLVARAYLFLGLFEAAAAMGAYFFVLRNGGWNFGQELSERDLLYRQATTACFSAIILMQVVNLFLCRSRRESVFRPSWTGNKLIWLGIGIELAVVLLIVYTPWGNRLFGAAPIGGTVWLFILPFAGLMLVCEEIRKALVRMRLPGLVENFLRKLRHEDIGQDDDGNGHNHGRLQGQKSK